MGGGRGETLRLGHRGDVRRERDVGYCMNDREAAGRSEISARDNRVRALRRAAARFNINAEGGSGGASPRPGVDYTPLCASLAPSVIYIQP